MLYDNSQLARVYLHAWQVTGNEFFRTITEEILDYVIREMLDPEDVQMLRTQHLPSSSSGLSLLGNWPRQCSRTSRHLEEAFSTRATTTKC
jgi:hypothetical protein